MFRIPSCTIIVAVFLAVGCAKHRPPHITAVSLSPPDYGCETGIPFYLPKPLLIVAKNFRNIETDSVGLTDSAPIPNSFDDQAKYADVNARTNFNFDGSNGSGGKSLQSGDTPGGTSTAEKSAPHRHTAKGAPISPQEAPSDGLAPRTFYTYHIVFVPDLTQKYGLKIRGGPGEIRAAMNLVNGWQFTGMGPYYMKDSSTAQNILSAGIATRLGGQAVADVVKSVADLSGALQSSDIDASDQRVQSLARSIEALPKDMVPRVMSNYAEIYVYEAQLTVDGQMTWVPIAEHTFDRHYLGRDNTTVKFARTTPATGKAGLQNADLTPSPKEVRGPKGIDSGLARAAVAQVLGIPQDSPALRDRGGVSATLGKTQSEDVDVAQRGATNQSVEVNVGGKPASPRPFYARFPRLHLGRKKNGNVQSSVVRVDPNSLAPSGPTGLADPGKKPESVRGDGKSGKDANTPPPP